jgi:hypothetical protein
MPFIFNVSQEDQIIYVTASGKVTIQDCLDAVLKRAEYAKSLKTFNTLVDMSPATSTPPIVEMRKIGSSIIGYKKGIKNRTAIVVKPEDINKASVICMLVRPFGIRMEAYGDSTLAMRYLETGESWLR